MSEHHIERLERQVQALLHEYDRKKTQNSDLRSKQGYLLKEKVDLQEKVQLARRVIRKIIDQLKQME